MTQAVEPSYSPLWFKTFLDGTSPEQTVREVAFLKRQLPLPSFARVLDLCCGPGRHALPLAAAGYAVTGIDRDATAIERAHVAAAERATFLQRDVRALADLDGVWDAVIIMWASFGYFGADENVTLLRDIHAKLRPGGRLVLDVYHREWFAAHQGEYRRRHTGVDIVERKQLDGDRLSVELRYDGIDVVDRFSWQVFSPAELSDVLADVGFSAVALCTGFDEPWPATAQQPRMQLVVERRSAR